MRLNTSKNKLFNSNKDTNTSKKTMVNTNTVI